VEAGQSRVREARGTRPGVGGKQAQSPAQERLGDQGRVHGPYIALQGHGRRDISPIDYFVVCKRGLFVSFCVFQSLFIFPSLNQQSVVTAFPNTNRFWCMISFKRHVDRI
jgi:hypothetical protein